MTGALVQLACWSEPTIENSRMQTSQRSDATPDEIKHWLSVHEELVHVTVEVNQQRGLRTAGEGASR